MNRKVYKIALIAEGVGFIMGILTLLILRMLELQSVYA